MAKTEKQLAELMAEKCSNLSWKLKRLQTLWFDGIGKKEDQACKRKKEPR